MVGPSTVRVEVLLMAEARIGNAEMNHLGAVVEISEVSLVQLQIVAESNVERVKFVAGFVPCEFMPTWNVLATLTDAISYDVVNSSIGSLGLFVITKLKADPFKVVSDLLL